jgi:hypothetical protein
MEKGKIRTECNGRQITTKCILQIQRASRIQWFPRQLYPTPNEYNALCLLACWEIYTGSLWTLGIGESVVSTGISWANLACSKALKSLAEEDE